MAELITPIASELTEENLQNRIDQEYVFYSEEVKPLVDIVEVYYGATPDGVASQARDFLGHITNAVVQKDDSLELRIANVNAAHSHLRRLQLDCYKLMCIYKQSYIQEFKHKYRYYNLNDVDDGEFAVTLKKLSDAADSSFIETKHADRTGKNEGVTLLSGDDVYAKYCDTFDSYCKAADYIDSHYDGVIRMARKSIWANVISISGWIIGIVVSAGFGIASLF